MQNGVQTMRWQGSRVIAVPQWLWLVMGACVLWAGYVTMQLTSLAATMATVAAGVQTNQATIERLRGEQLSRARSLYAVERLEEDVRKLEGRVERLERR